MKDSNVLVGLDYHQDSVQVCVMDTAGKVLGNRRCVNERGALWGCVEGGAGVQAAVEVGNRWLRWLYHQMQPGAEALQMA